MGFIISWWSLSCLTVFAFDRGCVNIRVQAVRCLDYQSSLFLPKKSCYAVLTYAWHSLISSTRFVWPLLYGARSTQLALIWLTESEDCVRDNNAFCSHWTVYMLHYWETTDICCSITSFLIISSIRDSEVFGNALDNLKMQKLGHY